MRDAALTKLRKGETEDRPGARGAGVAASAVSLRDRLDDRQPEPDSTAIAVAGRIGAREAVEDPRERVGGDPLARIGDLDRHFPSVGARTQLDLVRRLRVLDRVLEQRVERLAQPFGIGAQDAGRNGPSRQARGATSDQRMKTSSRKGSSSISSRTTKSG